MIDPAKTSAIIIAHPDLRVAPDLILWLLDVGIPRANVCITRGNDRDQCAAYNAAVEMSLTRKVDWCLFGDCDVRPHAGTRPMLAHPYDITCAMCDGDNGLAAWSTPDAWHSALWVARRDALSKVKAPWFGWTYNATGSRIEGCVCAHFAKRAKSAGLTIGHAGHAHHWPRGAKLPDHIPVLTSPA